MKRKRKKTEINHNKGQPPDIRKRIHPELGWINLYRRSRYQKNQNTLSRSVRKINQTSNYGQSQKIKSIHWKWPIYDDNYKQLKTINPWMINKGFRLKKIHSWETLETSKTKHGADEDIRSRALRKGNSLQELWNFSPHKGSCMCVCVCVTVIETEDRCCSGLIFRTRLVERRE